MTTCPRIARPASAPAQASCRAGTTLRRRAPCFRIGAPPRQHRNRICSKHACAAYVKHRDAEPRTSALSLSTGGPENPIHAVILAPLVRGDGSRSSVCQVLVEERPWCFESLRQPDFPVLPNVSAALFLRATQAWPTIFVVVKSSKSHAAPLGILSAFSTYTVPVFYRSIQRDNRARDHLRVSTNQHHGYGDSRILRKGLLVASVTSVSRTQH